MLRWVDSFSFHLFHGKKNLIYIFYLIHTNFRADLISCIRHRFISRVLIFAQPLKTNFRTYLFSRWAIFSNLNRPYFFFKELGFDRSFINIGDFVKKKSTRYSMFVFLKRNLKKAGKKNLKLETEVKNFAGINFRAHLFSAQILYKISRANRFFFS